jgi:hypothetical protein
MTLPDCLRGVSTPKPNRRPNLDESSAESAESADSTGNQTPI